MLPKFRANFQLHLHGQGVTLRFSSNIMGVKEDLQQNNWRSLRMETKEINLTETGLISGRSGQGSEVGRVHPFFSVTAVGPWTLACCYLSRDKVLWALPCEVQIL